MSRDDISNYIPYHRGLDVNFYAPIMDNDNQLFKKKTDDITWVDVTITASSINPDPLHERDMRDIDEELAMLDSKYGILKDHLTHTDNKQLVHNHQSKESLTKHGVILSHPYLDGENDHLKSSATEVHKVNIPLDEVKQFEKHLEKRKAFYHKSKLEYVEKLDKKTGEKTAQFDMGYI